MEGFRGNMKVLVINAGSSSIKYQLFEMPSTDPIAKGLLERIGQEGCNLSHEHNGCERKISEYVPDHAAGISLILKTLVDADDAVLEDISQIQAVGHRVVHGGEEFTDSCLVDDEVIASIERFSELAPLHNPANLTGIFAAKKHLPQAVQVACFDTAFHASIPKTAYLYALPYEIYEKYRVRRYGFHGTSHNYVARRAAELEGREFEQVNTITCHLGNGCSIAAVKAGKSVDTSMGFTPLEGVVMGTRSGDFDPAILFYLSEKGYTVSDLNNMCNKHSGLLGISGSSNDMRNLCSLASSGDERAILAIDIFAYRVRKYVGAYTAVLGSVDTIVFTGGIGENNAAIRAKICGNLTQLSIDVDERKNASVIHVEGIISSDSSRTKIYVIPTNEEGAIAKDTYRIVKSGIKN